MNIKRLNVMMRAAIMCLFVGVLFKGYCGASGPLPHSYEFAPEYHFDEHFVRFYHPKNDSFKERYFLENSLSLEGVFLSIDRHYFLSMDVILNFDMGRQQGAILLDPREVDMGFGPVFEYRAKNVIVQAGLDHHCFHQIDRVEWNTLYWNKLFVCAGSPGMREGVFREQLRRGDFSDWRRRLSWQAGYGFFVHELFGWLDTNALSWGNAYIHELSLSGRWAFLHRQPFAAFATWQNKTRIDRSGRWLWTEALGCEAATLKGDFGFSLYAQWTFCDQAIDRENRDKLIEAGFRVFR